MSDLTACAKQIRLDALTGGKQVLQGEYNLFLIRLLENGRLGERIFLTVLTAGDAFFPQPVFSCGGKDYILAAEAFGTAEIKEAAGNPQGWLERLTSAAEDLAAERIRADSAEELLSGLVRYLAEHKESRARLNRENREMTGDAVRRKIRNLGKLAGVDITGEKKNADPLTEALREIAEQHHMPFDKEAELMQTKGQGAAERLKQFAAISKWRVRKINLPGDFYKQSAGVLLGFRKKDNAPVVLFLDANGSSFSDPEQGGQKQRLDMKNADNFAKEAFCFYETFPAGRLTRHVLLRFVFQTARPVLLLILAAGLFSSLIGLVMPVATRYITQEVIPTANMPELWQVMALLLVLTACEIGIGIVPSLTMMLFTTRQYERFQAAVFDHILRIPVNAFRMCDSGDMTQRILGASQIQSAVFGIVTGQLLGSLFSLTSFVMMLYYSPLLAGAGCVLVLIYAVLFFLLSRINLSPLALQAAASGRVSGLLKQFFDGISKIRAAGAEQRVLSRFTDDFSEMLRQKYIISRNGAWQNMFSTVFPMMISVLFYALAGGALKENLSLPVFLAFMAAFQGFQGGLMGLAGGCWGLLAIKPELDRIMPVLETMPEDEEDRRDCGRLDGRIEASHLSFRYGADTPLVLQDVSFHADPGEFIAVVGPSGAGKSSLVRLLLGFEKPETGAVYYSGKDLANLDLRSVRRQTGVILQTGKILAGSILENIIVGTEYTAQDAWRALELAAFADEVREMPMGIHTLVMPENISGGQQQRILIARALVGSPPIVIMDESTSALDNAAQEIIKRNLEQLHTTRLVIAHRLSTIVQADRIYVLEKGRIVQQGTYAELVRQDGLFKNLVQRQLTERI